MCQLEILCPLASISEYKSFAILKLPCTEVDCIACFSSFHLIWWFLYDDTEYAVKEIKAVPVVVKLSGGRRE